jgi:hypothetical protein
MTLWLHVYGIKPAQPRKLFRKITALLRAEDRIAEGSGRSWTGSLVSETKEGPVTHVLIVSESAERHDLVHVVLEAELKKLVADITMVVPRQVRHA